MPFRKPDGRGRKEKKKKTAVLAPLKEKKGASAITKKKKKFCQKEDGNKRGPFPPSFHPVLARGILEKLRETKRGGGRVKSPRKKGKKRGERMAVARQSADRWAKRKKVGGDAPTRTLSWKTVASSAQWDIGKRRGSRETPSRLSAAAK